MALLTEEQIQDLYLQLDNVSSTSVMQKDIKEWNEKQTSSAEFEPDWSKASDNVISAVVHVTWVTKLGTWVGSYPVATFDRPAPVIIPHPHAEIMAKYAEVAARRVDPWVEFEYRCLSDNWSKCVEFLRFYDDYEYRYIGDNK